MPTATVQELAAQMGVDLSGIKPEFVSAIGTLVADANNSITTAKQLKEQAEANLALVKQEQDAINAYIEEHGTSEETRTALEANNAAMKAILETVKARGIAVDIPELKTVPAGKGGGGGKGKGGEFDPNRFRSDVSNIMAQGFNLNNKYQNLYGKALPDDIEVLADEARKAGKTLYDYASTKYNFAGKEEEARAKAAADHDAEVARKAVDEYKTKHPNTTGHPGMTPGVDSQFPTVQRPKLDGKDLRSFANMSPREKVAASVARTREAIAAAQQ